jgi:hypothetical protein
MRERGNGFHGKRYGMGKQAFKIQALRYLRVKDYATLITA